MMPKKNPSEKIVALAGNPNVGKSTVFNLLTGLHQHTGNWSGKTVENAWGYARDKSYPFRFVDLPGTYSLSAHSEEEKTARDFIISGRADLILVVCDACCLEKNLLLAQQILQLKSEVLLVINMINEAEAKGIYIDTQKMSGLLKLPVIGIDARKRRNEKVLLNRIMDCFDLYTRKEDCPFMPSSQICCPTSPESSVMQIETICRECILSDQKAAKKSSCSFMNRMDHFVTGKWTAFPILFFFLLFLFWLTITGANYPSMLLSSLFSKAEKGLFLVFHRFHIPDFVSDMLILGVFRVVSWVVSVMLPPMAIFFPLFTLLEDAGFLPRIAYNLDKPFQKCHACGKQALTMCMGFGCNAAGVVGCRIIDSPRERLIAILTNSFVPCNGRFPTLIALLTMFFVTADGSFPDSLLRALLLTLLIMTGIVMTFFASALLSRTILKGMPSAFLLELPPYRKPQFGKVLIRSFCDRTWFVLKRAMLTAAPAGLLLWLFANIKIPALPNEISLLSCCIRLLEPFGKLLGMDGTILTAFLLGLPANELVIPIMLMSYLCQGNLVEAGNLNSLRELLILNGWTFKTAVCVMLFSLFHWPCSTTLLTIKKETGSLKWTIASFFLPSLFGILLCILCQILFHIG